MARIRPIFRPERKSKCKTWIQRGARATRKHWKTRYLRDPRGVVMHRFGQPAMLLPAAGVQLSGGLLVTLSRLAWLADRPDILAALVTAAVMAGGAR